MINLDKLHISNASKHYIKSRFEDWKKEISDGKIWDSAPDFNLIILGTVGMTYEDRYTKCTKTINNWQNLTVDKALEYLEDAEWQIPGEN